MSQRALRILALAVAGLFVLGSNATSQIKDYGRLPPLENGLGRNVEETLEHLHLEESQRHMVHKILELEAVNLQRTAGNFNLSVAKRLVQAQAIRDYANKQIVSILTGEQRERLTKIMLKRIVKDQNQLEACGNIVYECH